MKTINILKGIALMCILFITACSNDDDINDDPVVVVDETPNLLGVVSYNEPQNLSADRSNPDRLSLDSPGEFFEINFFAPDDEAVLGFVSMSSISNDWLFATGEEGLTIFDGNGSPLLGDITDQVLLWDAGTEEENEATRGGGGEDLREDDDNPNVRVVESDVSQYIRVELTGYDVNTRVFTMRIENLRGEFADEDPIRVSPGVLVLHNENGPFFTAGTPDRREGLQLLAERGNFSELLESLNSEL